MKNLEQFRSMFDYFHEGIYIVDQDRKIIYFNKEATRISGFSHDEIIETLYEEHLLDHIDEDGNMLYNTDDCPLFLSMNQGEYADYHVYMQHKDGYRIKVHVRTIPIEENKKIVAVIEVFRETSLKNHLIFDMNEDQVNLFIDPLTELFNRQFYQKNIQQILKSKLPYQDLGFLFIDIDNFKKFNDHYGHLIGDQMLKIVSKTILNLIGTNDYAIRYGGEEIVVVFTNTDEQDLVINAEQIRKMVEKSILKENELTLSATISIGATLYHENEDITECIHRADQAMYQAKKTGKNKVVLLKKADSFS